MYEIINITSINTAYIKLPVKFFRVFECLLFSPRLLLFDHKYSKNRNIVKYHHVLK